jgi:uncharacterized protein (TIGR02145 family)
LNGSWNSALKIHAAGILWSGSGSLGNRGSWCNIWSISQYSSGDGWHLANAIDDCYMGHNVKAYGFSLRCIKDGGSSSTTPTVTTTTMSNITQTSAISGGNVTSDGGATVTTRGVCWRTTPNPTTADSHTTDGSGTGTFVSNLTGLSPGTPYYVRAYATNSVETAYGNELSFTTQGGSSCGTPIVDARDGKTYNTVQIGTQCWMAQSLNVGIMIDSALFQSANGILEKWCYNNIESNCDEYGGLYEWYEFMNYTSSSSSNPSGRPGICPAGWHIPSDAELTQLVNYLGGDAVAGGKMKEAGTVHWDPPNEGATNSSGFTALGAGYQLSEHFENIKKINQIWSSTEYNSTWAKYRELGYSYENCFRYNTPKHEGKTGRCLKDYN